MRLNGHLLSQLFERKIYSIWEKYRPTNKNKNKHKNYLFDRKERVDKLGIDIPLKNYEKLQEYKDLSRYTYTKKVTIYPSG